MPIEDLQLTEMSVYTYFETDKNIVIKDTKFDFIIEFLLSFFLSQCCIHSTIKTILKKLVYNFKFNMLSIFLNAKTDRLELKRKFEKTRNYSKIIKIR